SHQPPGASASAEHTGAGAPRPAPKQGLQQTLTVLMHARDGAHPTSTAHTRQANAQRAAHAAQALHHHARASARATAGVGTEGAQDARDNIEEALIELLTDLHHLCDTCDLELTTLLQAAALIHANETRPR
ncbi:hypothetical protein GTQ99_21520, partial [Kineococcus sp. T13]|uniref:hypothetical protein n=1 Tax=Kineococcus vitellinus TaxID=2696565 RepID=UPI001411D3CB